jgi:hypothetical protein
MNYDERQGRDKFLATHLAPARDAVQCRDSVRCDVPEALFFSYPQDGGYKSLKNVSNYLPENKTSYHRGFEFASKALRRLQVRVALLISENGLLTFKNRASYI